MRKKSIFVTIAFIISLKIMAQYHVVDSISKVPIPYVIVSINDKNTGTYTDESGNFEFNDLTEDNILVFKHIGYNQKEIKFKNIISNNLIELTPINYLLKEVTVTNKKLKDIEIGFSKVKPNSTYGSTGFGSEISTLVKNNLYQGKKIKFITFQIRRIYNIKSLIRLHIYLNNAGEPGDELFIKNNFITIDKKTESKIIYDISQSNIFFPVEGLFIGYEWIGELNNENKLARTQRVISPYARTKVYKNTDDRNCYLRMWQNEWFIPNPPFFERKKIQPLFGIIIEP